MKKFFYLSIIVSLFLYSCKRKSLPIEPGELGKELTKENKLPTVLSVETIDGDRLLEDYDTTLADIQDIIFIYFSEPMDKNSLLNSVEIKLVGGRGVNVPSGIWIYEKESNRLIYKLSENVGYSDSTKYEIIIKSSATDLSGNPLDGNKNNFKEEKLDDYHITLWTNKGNFVPDPDYDPPHFISVFSNLVSPNPSLLGGLVRTKDSIHVRFFVTDIDKNTVKNSFHLYEYETNLEIPLGTPIFRVDTLLTRTNIIFKGFSLNYSKVYKLVINTALKDINGNSLDGNNNGFSEADYIDRVEILFATFAEDSSKTDFPSYKNHSRDNNLIYFRFDELMDTTTINFNTVKLFRDYLRDAVPFKMRKLQDHQNKKTYIELTLLSNKNDPVYLWISRNVKDLDGLKLDSNGDNIGGIEEVDNKIVYIP